MTAAKLIYFIIIIRNMQGTTDDDPFCKTNCGSENVVCNTNCKPSPLNYTSATLLPYLQKQLLFELHNRYREKLAVDRQIGNMEALSYSSELAFSAQCWANKGLTYKDPCIDTPNFPSVGQIMYSSNVTHTAGNAFLKKAVLTWYEEATHLKTPEYEYDPETSDAAQFMWAKTTHFGCGRVGHKYKSFLFCNYAPKGALNGEDIYQTVLSNCTRTYSKYLCGNVSEEMRSDYSSCSTNVFDFVLNLFTVMLVLNLNFILQKLFYIIVV